MYLNPHIPHHELIDLLRKTGEELASHRQVLRRLKELLSTRKRLITSSLQASSRTQAQAERLAVLNPRYLQLIHEILELSATCNHLRIRHDTAQMLYNSRQSRNAFLRP